MIETPIRSTFVGHTAQVGFADAVDAADRLIGTEISVGSARLLVKERIGEGLAGAAWYSGVLRTGSKLVPSVRVDVVVSPWSSGRVEIGIRPLGRLGGVESLRAGRFFHAAWALLPSLTAALSDQPERRSAPVEVAAAA
ncbi:MAG TPA: hypothetical protein VG435_01800 [Acidimicrobiales bacterium]|jgi:hypothetical protein|nr:hypothetical protein [Acidimicrobiales bacterium]